jgi:hypothetical protein
MTNLHSGNTNGTNGFNGFRPQAPLNDPAAPAAQDKHVNHDTIRPIRSIQQLDGRWVVTDRVARGFAPTPATRVDTARAPQQRHTPPVIRRTVGERPAAVGTSGQPGTALALVRFLETSGTSQDLVAQAGQHLFDQSTTPRQSKRWLRRIIGASGLLTLGESLHGNQAVTKEVRDQAHLPAQMLSISTLLDFFGSQGLFRFVFQSTPMGGVVATAFSLFLLQVANRSGSGMVNRLKSNGTAVVSMLIFAGISTFQSLTTGVGIFLFNGQPRVVNHRAAELVAVDFERRRQRLATWRDPANNALLLADLQACETNVKQLKEVGVNNPAYQQLSVETYGLWQDRRVAPSNQPRWVLQNWPRERWPICDRAAANKADLERKIANESQQLETLEKGLQDAPSAAAFLRTSQPQVFEEHFRSRPDGTVEMKDSLKAFGAAWSFFWSPPAESRSDLTLSLLMMWISIGTSGGAFLLLLHYSLKDETKMSFSELCGQHRGELLTELQRQLPDEMAEHFRELEAREHRDQRPLKDGVKLSEIDKLNPEFQTLAHLIQNGDSQVRRLAREQYFERLVDLFIQRSSVTGEIDYAYLANKVKRYWADLSVADQARVTPHGFSGSGRRP